MKSIVIIGGSSFIGRYLCNYFLNREYEVISMSRHCFLDRKQCQEIKFDLEDTTSCYLAVRRIRSCDACINLTWVDDRKRENIESNMNCAKQLFSMMKLIMERFPNAIYIQMGSAAEYGMYVGKVVDEDCLCNPISAYGKAKFFFYRQMQQYCQESKIIFCELRLHSVFGKEDSPKKLIIYVISELLKGRKVVLRSNCQQRWNFLSVNNLCEIVYRIVERGICTCSVYNVGCNDCRRLKDYLEQIRRLCNANENLLEYGIEMDNKAYDFEYNSFKIQSEFEWIPKADFDVIVKEIINDLRVGCGGR